MTKDMDKMCEGFDRAFWCIYNAPYVLVDAEHHEDKNWYVPKFLTRLSLPNMKYIYAMYPQGLNDQDTDRMKHFGQFYAKLDSDTRKKVLECIMEVA